MANAPSVQVVHSTAAGQEYHFTANPAA